MNITIVDYNSGNISSVVNSFKEVAQNKVNIEVTSDLKKIKSSDKVVLPGQGSFKSCVDALNKINGLVDTLNEFGINNKKPFLGICVGLQMFADIGYEEVEFQIDRLCKELPSSISVLFGAPSRDNNSLFNSAYLIRNNIVSQIYNKQELPNYGVFDEKRYFSAGNDLCVFECKNKIEAEWKPN